MVIEQQVTQPRKKKAKVRHEPVNGKSVPKTLSCLSAYASQCLQDCIINFQMEQEVFGYVRKTFVLKSEIKSFADMDEVGANCIVMYMR